MTKHKDNGVKNNYKDRCDICGRFDYLKGKDNKCLCQDCLKKLEKEGMKNER